MTEKLIESVFYCLNIYLYIVRQSHMCLEVRGILLFNSPKKLVLSFFFTKNKLFCYLKISI